MMVGERRRAAHRLGSVKKIVRITYCVVGSNYQYAIRNTQYPVTKIFINHTISHHKAPSPVFADQQSAPYFVSPHAPVRPG